MPFQTGEIIDIPSPIDVHIHLREPGATHKETIGSGTLAALAGGYQAVFDMPNNPGGNETRSAERLDEKIAIARQTAHTHIGFYAGTDIADPAFGEFPALVRNSAGLKLYMDHTTGNTEKYDLQTVRPVIDAWITEASRIGKQPPILLHAREEIGALTAQYIVDQGYKGHWCHLSTATEASYAVALTARYPEYFSAGVTPHHLTMTSRNADFQQGWNGARMQPPLASEHDAQALLTAYSKGTIQILETDHAPHTEQEKLAAEAANPEGLTDPSCTTCFGISGIEFVLPVMMSLVQRRLVDMDRLVDSLHTQPLRMLGIQMGKTALRENVTTLKIAPRVLNTHIDTYGKSTNAPYTGWTGWAEVVSVRRGRQVFSNFMGSLPEEHRPIKIVKTGTVI